MPHTTNRQAVTAAVVMGTFLAALDTTVVGTAMPTIIGSLGGLALYSWVFSSYLLTSTVTVPIYGKLADIYGRKPVFLVGATLFIAGSALCGLSSSMEMLILFRAVQGLGAGAVLPVAITVVADIYPVAERPRVQAMMSAVWATSALIGPAMGGLITDYVSWRWVFYVNIPFGTVAIALFWAFLHESVPSKRRTVDYAGSGLLVVSLTLLLIGLMQNGQNAGALPTRLATLAAAALLGGLFLLQERRAPEPILPLSLFRSRVISVASVVGLAGGAVLFGVSSFIPPFLQGVQGTTATTAGATLAAMSIGWPVGSTLGARLILSRGYRPVVMLGTGLIAAGSATLVAVDAGTSLPAMIVSMLMIGLGMGFSSTPLLVAVQSAVGWSQRGVATASTQFFRSIGGAVGVAVMGAILNARMAAELPDRDAASAVLEPAARAAIPPEMLETVTTALASSLHSVYLAIAIVAAGGLALSLLFPRGTVEEHAHTEVPAEADDSQRSGRGGQAR
jgi:EmrB/QacA subfamily drug resistance transporter